MTVSRRLRNPDGARADAGATGLHQDGFASVRASRCRTACVHGTERDRRAGGVAQAHASGPDHEPRRNVDEVARETVEMEAHRAADILARIIAALAAALQVPQVSRP